MRSTSHPTWNRGGRTPAATRPPTSSATARVTRPTCPTRSSTRRRTTRCSLSSPALLSTTSQSCPTPAAPRWSADSLPIAASSRVDLRRLDQLVALDEISRTATLQAGVRGPAAEALLAERGYTLGHFPQSYEGASIGGYAAARSSGQSSAGYGRFDQMVVGLTLATPRGTIELGRAPMSAAGPDLRQLVLGSEGAFGIITSVVRTDPAATDRAALRGLAVRELRRRSDRDPAARAGRAVADGAAVVRRGRDRGEPGRSGCARWRVGRRTGDHRVRRAVQLRDRREVLTAAGGQNLGDGPG